MTTSHSPASPEPLPVTADILSTLSVVAWYALPDFFESRRVRAFLKAGLLAGGAAYLVPNLRGATAAAPPAASALPDEAPERPDEAEAHPGRTVSTDRSRLRSRLTAVAAVAAVVGVVAGSAVATVRLERVVYRFGDRAASRGVVLPHTRIGVVLGALTAAVSVAERAVGRRRRP